MRDLRGSSAKNAPARRAPEDDLEPTRDEEGPLSIPARSSAKLPRKKTAAVVGDVLADRYLVTSVLGAGGTASVYSAHDRRLERDVAVKLLADSVRDPQRFLLGEARSMAGVRSPHVVSVFDAALDALGPILVMELVDGGTLKDLLLTRTPNPAECLDILDDVARGLDAIHEAGFVHGDIKPSNILIDTSGTIKITDFGLVSMIDEVAPGDVVGTPAYMPPERIEAVDSLDDRHALSPASDIYSLAVMAFEMLACSLPFVRDTPRAYLYAHLVETPPTFSSASGSRSFDPVFRAALSKQPHLRPRTASGFVRGLRDALSACDAHGKTLRVLVVDDDDDLRSLLSVYLVGKMRGAVVETAADGHLALEAMRNHPPHVAIVDLGMPGLSGIDLLREITTIAPTCPVIVITGHGSGPEWREARALGVRRFLIKPVTPSEIVETVKGLVRED